MKQIPEITQTKLEDMVRCYTYKMEIHVVGFMSKIFQINRLRDAMKKQYSKKTYLCVCSTCKVKITCLVLFNREQSYTYKMEIHVERFMLNKFQIKQRRDAMKKQHSKRHICVFPCFSLCSICKVLSYLIQIRVYTKEKNNNKATDPSEIYSKEYITGWV